MIEKLKELIFEEEDLLGTEENPCRIVTEKRVQEIHEVGLDVIHYTLGTGKRAEDLADEKGINLIKIPEPAHDWDL